MNETDQQPPTGKRPQRRASLARLVFGGKKDESHHLGTRLRNYLFTGLIIVGPVSITIYIVWWFVGLIDAWVKPLLPSLAEIERNLPFELPFPLSALPNIPGVGLIVAIIGLMLIGALTANLFGRTIFGYGELMLGRMPIVRNVYGALKQIFETVLSKSGSSFQRVGLIEYPRKGIYSIIFISTETRGEIQARHGADPLISVFLPTTPNPTSGFLLFVPARDVKILDMSVEEAAKLIISAGLVVPEHTSLDEAAQRIEEAARHSGHDDRSEPAQKHGDTAPV
jgi:uncharacterized membrane protein